MLFIIDKGSEKMLLFDICSTIKILDIKHFIHRKLLPVFPAIKQENLQFT